MNPANTNHFNTDPLHRGDPPRSPKTVARVRVQSVDAANPMLLTCRLYNPLTAVLGTDDMLVAARQGHAAGDVIEVRRPSGGEVLITSIISPPAHSSRVMWEEIYYPWLSCGKLAANWAPGDVIVKLTPVTTWISATPTGAPDIECLIVAGSNHGGGLTLVPPPGFQAVVGDVLLYQTYFGQALNATLNRLPLYILVNPPIMPYFTQKYQVFQNAAENGQPPQLVADFLRAS